VRASPRLAVAALCALLAGTVPAAGQGPGAAGAGGVAGGREGPAAGSDGGANAVRSGGTDLRGVVLLDLDCRSQLGRWAVTLFANGTVRRRQDEEILLTELTPEELGAYLRRLAGEDLSETDPDSSSVDGEWVERCALELALPEQRARNFTFARYASLSLALSRVVAIARELGERAEREDLATRHLPVDYKARQGDVLERRDGVLYEVVGFTSDSRGVELEGVEQPFTLYVRVEDLRREFVAVVSRRWP
jgi:hypothetical protein